MSDDFDATTAPGVVLYTHILQKGFQLGSVLGTGAVAPAQAAYQKIKLKLPLDTLKLAKYVGTTTLGAFSLLAVLGAVKVSRTDWEGLEDRAYRLHYNKGQNRTDTFAQAGAAAGLAAGVALLRGAANVSLLHYLGCSSAGAAGGILLHVLTSPKDE